MELHIGLGKNIGACIVPLQRYRGCTWGTCRAFCAVRVWFSGLLLYGMVAGFPNYLYGCFQKR